MFRFVTYSKKTGAITGGFEISDKEHLPIPQSDDEAYMEVTERDHVDRLLAMNPARERIAGNVASGGIESLQAEDIFAGRLEFETDLRDADGDGAVEMAADGEAVARLRVRLARTGGRSMEAPREIQLRTTRGTLSRRSVTLDDGEVEYRGVPETVRAEVTARAKGVEPARLAIEFVPVEEHRRLYGEPSS